MASKKKLVLVDGHAQIFRAFYAVPYLTAPDGRMTNAVYGFTSTLLSVIEDLEPEYIAVVFDSKGPTLRKKEFEAYKAQRKKPPEELIEQIPLAEKMTDALNIPRFSIQGYEGDDLIGTLARQACQLQATSNKQQADEIEVMIVSGDLDLLQLVEDGCVSLYVPGTRRRPTVIYNEELALGKVGVRVDQVPDLKGLAGDASDNIPGVKGLGPKTAVKLLKEFGTVEKVYEEMDKLEDSKAQKNKGSKEVGKETIDKFKKRGIGKAMVEKLFREREMALKSKELATIMRDAPIELDLEACKVHGYDKDKTLELFDDFGFKSLKDRLPKDEFEVSVQDALF